MSFRAQDVDVAIIGGGAAGFFAALSAKEQCAAASVAIFEKSSGTLSKVKISGGGRCNVTHSCFDPRELIKHYPRGARELLGPFHVWQPSDTVAWFESRGVRLKTEPDGRMFPTTDSSATIIDCLESHASRFHITIHKRYGVTQLNHHEGRGEFQLHFSDGHSITARRVIIASGGGAGSGGIKLAQSLGHTITSLAPSLFTFHIKDKRLTGLQGLSIKQVSISCPEAKLQSSGPMLITHWGLSGPAILKLSALGARKLQECQYRFTIHINWTHSQSHQDILNYIQQMKSNSGNRKIENSASFDIPRRIWSRLREAAGIPAPLTWAQLSKSQSLEFANQLTQCQFNVSGKSMNKEEFVTCGGVALKEIQFKRMESKLVDGLFFAGEVLDIDGVTGGFNFQAAWTTGRIAGTSASQSLDL